MPKKGNRKRLKFKAGDVCSESVTVADYADADPAVVKSGRVKKAVANAVAKEVKLLCGLEASQGAVEEVLSSAVSVQTDALDSSDDLDPEEDGENETKVARKKKNKRRKESSESSDGGEYPVDIWLVLSSYIRPEDVCRFALICRNAWTVTCTAAFWSRLYRRHYRIDVDLPFRLQPDTIHMMRCLRARVIRSLFHLYEPFSLRVSKIPALPESTPTTLLNSKCLLFWVKRVSGTRPDALWEFNFKFIKQQVHSKNGCAKSLHFPRQYEDVHTNPDSDCYVLQVTTLNFIFTPVVMGMTLTLFTINVSTDMRHHRVRLVFQDAPLRRGKKRGDQGGTQVVLDPVHSVRLMDWWHPQYPYVPST
ncbi:transmembrane protein 183A [Seriola lalandi dorsalis]|uniref:Transmembrane protein 183A n=1 Tax=Seriola lalandi dorsalis TaxID=1841481 RepID=A0A3B4X0Z7_SERLL|nr:transmembrane protein 183A [Seriola lalandi dorsalis]XP_056219654.1 transmembrane protein 183A [Seriola aureovittata]